ncbi:hypothetical protein HY623_04510 [Candidatus Uhrbacteria bacterium]|nr:hypothetical protein [Candidatus Uhrbacteria bacterium]
MKRILLIIGFVAIVILLVVLIWYFFFRPLPPREEVTLEEPVTKLPIPGEYIPPEGPGVLTSPTTAEEQLPETAMEAQGGPVQTAELDSGNNIGSRIAPDGSSVVTFDSYAGTFYRITPDGMAEKLTDQTFAGATNVTLSPNNERAVIEFLDDSKILYDFSRKQQVATLPKHWEAFDFSPDGGNIVFKSIATNPDNNWFAIANADGSDGQELELMGKKINQFTPLWSPSDQIVGFYEEGVDADRKQLYFIGKYGENFQAITVEGRGIKAQWSPLGTQLLYSAYSAKSGFRPEVWIVDALGDTIGENRRKLDIQTWADKCGFAGNETLYCSVPKIIPEGGGLLPVVAEEKSGGEVIYKIDLTTGERQKVAEPRSDLIAQNLQVSKDQTYLFFTNKYSGKLYSIQLQ